MPKKILKKSAVHRASPERRMRSDFDQILTLIEGTRVRAIAAVNTTLIDLYWSIGKHISGKIIEDGWGKGTVRALADYIQGHQPNARIFVPKSSGGCYSFTRPTRISQNSQHC